MSGWEILDIQGLLEAQRSQRTEATTAANAGPYAVPLGGSGARVFRSVFPAETPGADAVPAEYQDLFDLLYDE